MDAVETGLEPSRAKRLKAATSAAHAALDDAIMGGRPFSSREAYASFLQIQQGFHRDVAALYALPGLAAAVPGLATRARLDLILADLADLGETAAVEAEPPRFRPTKAPDLPTAWGWLYVAEGSNLGAAFLLKAAAGLGLSADFGARHLAASPEGRAAQWRSFTTALDAAPMTPAEELRLADGAAEAFSRVRALVEAAF